MDGCKSVIGGSGFFFATWFGIERLLARWFWVKAGVPAAWNLRSESITMQYFSELVEGVADLAA